MTQFEYKAWSAKRGAPFLISFSGLDGSGKSTQIEAAIQSLKNRGCRVRRLAFWDDVVVLTRYRESFVHKVYRSEQGIGAPGKPVNRRDKNVRRWYLTLARHLLYLLDALHLRWVITREAGQRPDVILMDRYIYDELANLPLNNLLTRAFVRLMARLAPQPHIALLLDADPDAAHARKPEYPIAFMRECRQWYHSLAALLGNLRIVPPLPLADAKREVEFAIRQALKLDGKLTETPESLKSA